MRVMNLENRTGYNFIHYKLEKSGNFKSGLLIFFLVSVNTGNVQVKGNNGRSALMVG